MEKEQRILATDIGARVSSRITLWRLGYRMGYEQLQAQCHALTNTQMGGTDAFTHHI